MSTLLDRLKKVQGKNQARMELIAHCESVGIDYREYEMTLDEKRAYFNKLPYSPFSRFDMNSAERENDQSNTYKT